MSKYAIGVDYGTLSGRAVIVDLTDGQELAVAVYDYPHGVMDERLPSGEALPPDFALQHPRDYIDVLARTIPALLEETSVNPADVVGIGIDFTACTILPVDEKGVPLCYHERYERNPHSYVKLWKHHAAQDEANRLNEIAEEHDEKFLQRYGGKISSEWMIPKIWQVLNESPEIYDTADRFMEAADWVVMRLCGVEARNSCTAGYKAIWSKAEGYPSKAFFAALDKRLENVVEDKLSTDIYALGQRAGGLTEEMARLTGLCVGTSVAVANVDAHVSAPALGITTPGKMLMIMGTSTCHIMIGETVKMVPGMCGVVEDGVVPGYPGYEAGQSCVGDHFDWFVKNLVPAKIEREAEERGISVHELLSEQAALLKPGESGLVALDWWNGNRSVLVDVDLSGLIIGMTLKTKAADIYRALIEATAYGTRKIIETFEKSGVPVDELYACGGIAEKNPLVMQIYADVCNREIRISGSPQAPALGAAMFGAVAAGKARGGFDTIDEAAKVCAKLKSVVYCPNHAYTAIYDELYAEYNALHELFGRENAMMKRLRHFRG